MVKVKNMGKKIKAKPFGELKEENEGEIEAKPKEESCRQKLVAKGTGKVELKAKYN